MSFTNMQVWGKGPYDVGGRGMLLPVLESAPTNMAIASSTSLNSMLPQLSEELGTAAAFYKQSPPTTQLAPITTMNNSTTASSAAAGAQKPSNIQQTSTSNTLSLLGHVSTELPSYLMSSQGTFAQASAAAAAALGSSSGSGMSDGRRQVHAAGFEVLVEMFAGMVDSAVRYNQFNIVWDVLEVASKLYRTTG